MTRIAIIIAALFAGGAYAAAPNCGELGNAVQVLGSGGPELQSQRASSGYLVWLQGKPRILIDVGGGSALRFGESGANVSDLDVILLSHLHADHTSDLPAVIKSSFFEERRNALPLYGPGGNKIMPGTVGFVRALFDPTRGAYRYLSPFISPQNLGTYKLRPFDIDPTPRDAVKVFSNAHFEASATSMIHGNVPALAWRIQVGDKAVVFSGDTSDANAWLERIAAGAQMLVAHHTVLEGATGVERDLHMPPSVIGRVAHLANVKRLVLSHRSTRTLGHETESTGAIRKYFSGPLDYAEDLACYPL